MSHLAHLVSSAFKVREVPPLCTCSECNKARSRATSAADVHLVAQPVGLPEQEVPGSKRNPGNARGTDRNRRVYDFPTSSEVVFPNIVEPCESVDLFCDRPPFFERSHDVRKQRL